MTELLCLLVGVLLTLVGLGMMVRRGARPLAAAAVYRNVGWRLGLEADTRGTSLRGELDGRRLYIGAVPSSALVGALEIDPPLGLGVRIRPRAMGDRIRRRQGAGIGDPEVDDAFDVRGEPDVVRPLFTEGVRAALDHLVERWRDFEIKDDVVRVFLRTPVTTDARMQDLIDSLRRTSDALAAARRGLPTPADLGATLGAWQQVASARGWEVEAALPVLRGQLDGRPFQACLARSKDGAVTARVRVDLASHRALGLSVTPQAHEGGVVSTGQDITTGDRTFDDAFVVRGYDPHAVRAVLGDGARAALVTLAGHGRLLATDRRLEVDQVAPEGVEAAIDAARAAAVALGW